ncbi:MAG: hypothetical protein GC162_14420 [Planctomycetes bacterium]|nr:hypothetical protein [Planctomycetota bacterium]
MLYTFIMAPIAAYFIAGLLFAMAFVTLGLTRVDHAAAGSGFAFRLMLVPGAALLWPVLAVKWLQCGSREVHP